MKKRVDLHVHSEFSNDSNLKVEEILKKALKYDFYVAIADHNEIGGYLKSQKLNNKGRVIAAIEAVSSEGVHILFYFVRKENLIQFYINIIDKYKTNDLYRLDINAFELMKAGKEHKAFIGIPHPFAKVTGLLNSTIDPTEHLKLADFYEKHNSSVTKSMNTKAALFHKNHQKNIPIIVGSDAHFLDEVGNILLEIDDFKSQAQLFKNLKKKGAKIIGHSKLNIMSLIKKELILIKKSKKLQYIKCRINRLSK